eukprot:SAG25_NODE_9684_length_362_cov_1.178707_1_plen_101_part_10
MTTGLTLVRRRKGQRGPLSPLSSNRGHGRAPGDSGSGAVCAHTCAESLAANLAAARELAAADAARQDAAGVAVARLSEQGAEQAASTARQLGAEIMGRASK